MLKVPWRNSVSCYEYEDGFYRIACVKEFVMIREIESFFDVKRVKEYAKYNARIQEKLSASPFMLLHRSGQYRQISTEAVSQWTQVEDLPLVEGAIVYEDGSHFVNYQTFVNVYKQGEEGKYRIDETCHVFSQTMPVPTIFEEDLVETYQARRRRHVERQLKASRIFLASHPVYHCYNGYDFTHLKSFYSNL